ncbi:hypothetical protein FJZ28_03670 [Candidatus Peregrinibacteria bacterium]|nr:hypothetical protein [Candidatus Peregrinibacteria bacterium]
MNIILKAFDDDMGKVFTENITRGLSIGTCISIGDAPKQFPDLAKNVEHITMSARTLRAGQYPGVQWSDITPIDEELIEKMRPCEAMFLKMIGRYAPYGDVAYEERKRQYLLHLRYWNHMLDAKKIDLYVQRGVPHQCYDLVIWDLCKLKGIRTITAPHFFAVDAMSVGENWEQAGIEAVERFEELKKQYANPDTSIPLSREFEASFQMFAFKPQKPWYMKNVHPHLWNRTFIGKWMRPALRVLFRKPLYLLRSVVSPDFWHRKWAHHQTRSMYDRWVTVPDLTVPYVYAPLQMQPEATTCPMAGAYVDQELSIQLLAACLPKGVRIYVKEHPNQGEMWRSMEFYRSLHEIPSVTFVPRMFDSFTLTEHAVAIASSTGTALFEGLFKCKPAMMFGHKYFQYAPGVHRIRSRQDCERAVESIFIKKERHTLREMRLFLKALEETSCLTYKSPNNTVRGEETRPQRAKIMGEYIRAKILEKAYFLRQR